MFAIEVVSDGQKVRVEAPTLDEVIDLWRELDEDPPPPVPPTIKTWEKLRAGCRKTDGKI